MTYTVPAYVGTIRVTNQQIQIPRRPGALLIEYRSERCVASRSQSNFQFDPTQTLLKPMATVHSGHTGNILALKGFQRSMDLTTRSL
jgi:hypothetical protein